mmetsp:Transcript_312/g.695  ORF Transcript_312/g.695 Transcript_312/m.695 type:complete len:248 (-) Transcript_312:618-1361(-)
MSLCLDVLLREGELLPRCDLDHELHKVQTGDHLGDGVLHLQPRVHFEEIKVLVGVDHHLNGTSRPVVDRPCKHHRLLPHGAPRRLVDEGRRRLLNHLLIAALHRAVALGKIDDVAVRVRDNLDLNVPRLLHKLLHKDPIVAKRRRRLCLREPEALSRLHVVPRDAHALAPSSRRRLDHDGIPNVLGHCDTLGLVLEHPSVSRDRVDLGLLGQELGLDLVAHGFHRHLPRSDKDESLLLQARDKRRVL